MFFPFAFLFLSFHLLCKAEELPLYPEFSTTGHWMSQKRDQKTHPGCISLLLLTVFFGALVYFLKVFGWFLFCSFDVYSGIFSGGYSLTYCCLISLS